MKKHLFKVMAVGFVLLLATACSKTDSTPSPSIVGTWKLTSNVGTGCTDPANNYSDVCTLTAAECGILNITSSGTYTFTVTPAGGSPSTESGTYTTSGSTITTTGGNSGTFAYVVTTTTLTLTQVNSSTGCTEVTTLTRQ